MYIRKNFTLRGILRFSGGHIIWLTVWVGSVALIYQFTQWEWMSVPWQPLTVIGTAVAFYVGFKNNQAYDRLWEARKIWGAIVNSSRAWGSAVKGFVSDKFSDISVPDEEIKRIHQRLIYRHIAWLYGLRSQLLIPTAWEHINQSKHIAAVAAKRIKQFGIGLLDDDITEKNMKQLLPKEEYERLINYKNTATQIIDQQAQDLKGLHTQGLIDDFRHMELQKILYDFYVHQGKCERIKKFPLPRQYANMSFVFVGIFIFLLPFGMIDLFKSYGNFATTLTIPFAVLVGWIYLMMELVGDYSENPFEGMGNDIPMYNLTRVIELDLREMLGETELPPPVEAINGVLM
ncbi:MAG: bestrophin family ion channel [Bacteroidota bacterium]